jgi:hypothetical protein
VYLLVIFLSVEGELIHPGLLGLSQYKYDAVVACFGGFRSVSTFLSCQPEKLI